jgi:hypothetical protein
MWLRATYRHSVQLTCPPANGRWCNFTRQGSPCKLGIHSGILALPEMGCPASTRCTRGLAFVAQYTRMAFAAVACSPLRNLLDYMLAPGCTASLQGADKQSSSPTPCHSCRQGWHGLDVCGMVARAQLAITAHARSSKVPTTTECPLQMLTTSVGAAAAGMPPAGKPDAEPRTMVS